jgi:hypothetical protein
MCWVGETMSLEILRTSKGGKWMQNRNEVLLQLPSGLDFDATVYRR